MKKNPWIAAVANFFVPGLGYLYAGSKRMWFAILLVVGSVLSGYWMFINAEVYSLMTSLFANVIYLSWGIAFAIDGFNEAKKTK